MIRRCAAFLVLAACVALLSGCVSTDLTGAMMPGAQLPPSEVYFVEKFKPDGRGLDAVIRDQLKTFGKTATSGPEGGAPAEATIIVTYQDQWMWDMRMYLLQLDIQFKDPKTGHVLATGKSYRTSLAAKKPPEAANEILLKIFAEEGPK